MSFTALFIIAAGAAFGVGWTLHYVPLHTKIFKWHISPRLIICKFLAPFDAIITILLIGGAWIGFTTSQGIGSITFNVLSGIGISCGVLILRRWIQPPEEHPQETDKESYEKWFRDS
jgi:hypothetical protein